MKWPERCVKIKVKLKVFRPICINGLKRSSATGGAERMKESDQEKEHLNTGPHERT
jgi:hypothetical protein